MSLSKALTCNYKTTEQILRTPLNPYLPPPAPSTQTPPLSPHLPRHQHSTCLTNHFTLAHFHIDTSALESPTLFNLLSVQKRLLLLLATQNADRPPPPPSQLTQRLGMMTIFTEEIGAATNAIINVGVRKKPYFHDKAPAIAQSGE